MSGRLKGMCGLFLFLLLIGPIVSSARGGEASLESDWFILSGPSAAVEDLKPLVLPLEEWAGAHFRLPARLRPKIQIVLSAVGVDPETAYRVQLRRGNGVELLFRAGAQPGLETTALAMIQAIFLRKSLEPTAGNPRVRIPDWLYVSASAAFVESLQPGVYAQAPDPSWPGLVAAMRGEHLQPIPATAFHHGYYLWEFWREVAGGRRGFRRLLREVTTGEFEAAPWLERYGMPVIGEAELELGWRTWALSAFERKRGPVQSLRRSRLLVENLLEVDLEVEDRLVKASVADLWPNRTAPWWEEERTQRLEWVKRSLTGINPLYFNALHSLGSVLEAMEGSRRERFDLAVERLARDLEEADAVYQLLLDRGY